jgi:hypothetical protein
MYQLLMPYRFYQKELLATIFIKWNSASERYSKGLASESGKLHQRMHLYFVLVINF